MAIGIDTGIAMKNKRAYYPMNVGEQDEVELWLNIRAFSFSRIKQLRNFETGARKCDMWFPMPTKMETTGSVSYSAGMKEDGMLASAINKVTTIGGLQDIATNIFGWFESATGIANTVGKRDMDQREQIFSGANFRTHNYDWTFVPKDAESSARLFAMAYRLNALSYPGAALQTSKTYHPPLFSLQVYQGGPGGGKPRPEWDMNPQLSILESVTIDRTGAGRAYAVGPTDFLPAVWKIGLKFKEFEPLVRTQNTTERLVSRSVSDSNGALDGFLGSLG